MTDTRRILAIDPGPTKCGLAVLETSATPWDLVGVHNSRLCYSEVVATEMVLAKAQGLCVIPERGSILEVADELAMEMMGFQGQARNPGSSTFWTLLVIGRIQEVWKDIASDHPCHLVSRTRAKAHVAGPRANDSAVCRALAERFGAGSVREAKGVKAKPGPLYGIKSHAWQALAVAVALVEGVVTETPPWEQGS